MKRGLRGPVPHRTASPTGAHAHIKARSRATHFTGRLARQEKNGCAHARSPVNDAELSRSMGKVFFEDLMCDRKRTAIHLLRAANPIKEMDDHRLRHSPPGPAVSGINTTSCGMTRAAGDKRSLQVVT